MKKQLCCLAVAALLFSCKKELKNEFSNAASMVDKQNSKIVFSKALASAIEQEPALRAFIKNEALKQFDQDNDVLFQMVKDEKITGDKTFYQVISQHAQSKEELDAAINSIPTLTIMVPEVPNFSPESWNTALEIPLVAVSPGKDKSKAIDLFDAKGEAIKIEQGLLPGFPVVVIKENERVNVTVDNIDKSPASAVLLQSENSSAGQTFLSKNNMRFNFSNEAFNGISSAISLQKRNSSSAKSGNKTMSSNSNTISRIDVDNNWTNGTVTKSPNSIDPLVRQAFENNLDWQRDYVYYGLNPKTGTTKGKFNNRVVEHIVAIRMKDGELGRISDQAGDPTVRWDYLGEDPGRPRGSDWTDGYFDIRISVLINARNGAGAQFNKVISAKGTDLYRCTYKNVGAGRHPIYKIDQVIAKDFFINEPLIGWDLDNYGVAWKFIVSEYDPSEEIVTTHSETTKFASNFGFDAGFGEKVKLGFKFGASLETTSQSSYQYKTTRGSDDLGEGILEFGSPIIISKVTVPYTGDTRPPRGETNVITTETQYKTWEVSTGTIFLSVEPKLITAQ